jgi:L-iditol 2-dehydrogenase
MYEGETCMKVAKMTAINKIEIVEMTQPVPADDEVLIRMKSIGVCGSDVHLYSEGKIGKFVVQTPYILGHEPSGEIVAVGTSVAGFQVGDRIVMEPGVPCGTCVYCRRGEYNLCPDIQFLAAPPVPGALAEFITYNPDYCYRVPDDIDFDTATFAEPLSVGIAACQRGGVRPGVSVLVLGLGPIGQMCIIAGRSFGAARIYGSDPIESRRSIAIETGADGVVGGSVKDLVKQLLALTDGRGFDIVIDAAGVAQTANTALETVRVGGTIVMVGSTLQETVDFGLVRIMQKALNLVGSYRYAHTYPLVLDMIHENKDRLRRLITHRFNLDQTDQAFQTALRDQTSVMKIIINL